MLELGLVRLLVGILLVGRLLVGLLLVWLLVGRLHVWRHVRLLVWLLVRLLLMERSKRLEIVQTWLWNVGIMGSKVFLVLLCLNLSLSGEDSSTERGS